MDLSLTYDRIAEDWHADHLQDVWPVEAVGAFADLFPTGARVLDVGCADGIKTRRLVEKGLEVLGIDVSERFITMAKRYCPGAQFQVLDMRDVGQLGMRFDGVMALASLLHIPRKDIPEVLHTFWDVLKPGGYLFLAVKEIRPGQSEEQLVREDDYGYEYTRFFSYFRQEELEAWLKDLGMTIEGVSLVESNRTRWIMIIARRPLVMLQGKYRHYKGGEYRVLQLATHTETEEQMVVYQSLKDERVWARPLAHFLEEVILDGQSTPRFAYVRTEK